MRSTNGQKPATKPPMMKARLGYAARGWLTFPAPASGEKKSLKWANEKNGFTRWGATLDAAVIEKEFRSRRLKNQNIGICTGIESGIFVIETDTAEHGAGIDGEGVLFALAKKFGALPHTLMAVSPSGSVHRYYRHPGDGIKVKTTTSIFRAGSGVDVRGDAGMVLGPPSVRPAKPGKAGGVYRWMNPGTKIAKAPQWILDAVIDKPREAKVITAKTSDQAGRPGNVALIKAALAQYSSDCDYNTWWETCCGLRHEFSGSDIGYELFQAWSTLPPQYRHNHGECEAKWEKAAKVTAYTIGTVFHFAEQASPRWRAVHEARRLEATASLLRKVCHA